MKALAEVAKRNNVPCFFHGRFSAVGTNTSDARRDHRGGEADRRTGARRAHHLDRRHVRHGELAEAPPAGARRGLRRQRVHVPVRLLGHVPRLAAIQPRMAGAVPDLLWRPADRRHERTTHRRRRSPAYQRENKLAAAFAIPEADVRTCLRDPHVMIGSDAILTERQQPSARHGMLLPHARQVRAGRQGDHPAGGARQDDDPAGPPARATGARRCARRAGCNAAPMRTSRCSIPATVHRHVDRREPGAVLQGHRVGPDHGPDREEPLRRSTRTSGPVRPSSRSWPDVRARRRQSSRPGQKLAEVLGELGAARALRSASASSRPWTSDEVEHRGPRAATAPRRGLRRPSRGVARSGRTRARDTPPPHSGTSVSQWNSGSRLAASSPFSD